MKIMIRYIIRIDTKTIDRLSMIMNLYHMNYSRDIDRDINKAYISLLASLFHKATIEESHMVKLINSFFEMFTSVDSIPKREKYRKFIKSFFTDRKFSELFKDGLTAIKLLWSILIK